jgi:hypothetical protein
MKEEEYQQRAATAIQRSTEREFVLVMGYVIHKFLDGEISISYEDFGKFYDEGHTMERIDEEDLSIYRVL